MKSILKSIGAILIPFVAVFILSIITDMILEKSGVLVREPFEANSSGLIMFIVFYRTLYNALGCYFAARLAPANPMRYAMILGGIGFVLCIAGAIAMWHIPPHWYPISLIVFALPAAYLGGKLYTSGRINHSTTE